MMAKKPALRPTTVATKTGVPISFSWANRRFLIRAILLWCAGEVTYLTVIGADTRLNETIVSGVLLLMGSTIGSYVFGAVWDDRNARQAAVESEVNVLNEGTIPAPVADVTIESGATVEVKGG